VRTGVMRYRKHLTMQRGFICEEHLFRGARRGARCLALAVGYQRQWDVYVCGNHKSGYLTVEPLRPLATP
jgi:hypothetical protein